MVEEHAVQLQQAPAGPSVRVVNPLDDSAWDDFVASCEYGSVFHTSGWIRALCETYAFEASALAATGEGGRTIAAIPFIRLPGERSVSLPFSDLCEPLAATAAGGEALLSYLRDEQGKTSDVFFELRGDGGLALEERGFEPGTAFYRHTIDLNRALAAVEAGYSSAIKRAVRKAERDGVEVGVDTSPEAMRAFYALVVRTRRKQRLLPQPAAFYEAIRRNMGPDDGCFLLLAQYDGRIIGGDLLLRHNDRLVYKFNASDERYLSLRPNNLLLRSAIRLGVDLGCTELDLGRCDLDGHGLRRFKLGWGSREETLKYHFYPYRPPGAEGIEAFVRRRLLPRFVHHAPAWVLAYAGDRYYRRFA